MDQPPKTSVERLKQRVLRHSPYRLLSRPVVLAGGVKVGAEKHRGRIVIRIESPNEVDKVGDPAGPLVTKADSPTRNGHGDTQGHESRSASGQRHRRGSRL